MHFTPAQKKAVVEHYLENEGRDYDDSAVPRFSLSKMSRYSTERLGFSISKDSLSKILLAANVRPLSKGNKVKKVPTVMTSNLMWNSLLMWKWIV